MPASPSASGEVIGIATEIEDFPDGGGPGKYWDAHWTVMVPGVGSLYGYEIEIIVADEFEETMQMLADEQWTGSIERRMTSGPSPDGYGVIVGGTGAWEGATGRFAEVIHFSQAAPDAERVVQMGLRFILE